jgi:UDP-2,3-diacylglucosamine hydrolase
MQTSLGLVSGEGVLPAIVAREARRAGWRVVTLALGDPGELPQLADRLVRCRVGDVAPILRVLAEEGIRHVVLAGRVRKDALFHGVPLDAPARALVARSGDWTDDGLLETAVGALASLGIEVLDQRQFLGPWLASDGRVAGPAPTPAVEADIARGLAVARALARHGIGQTVVIRAGAVAAVEAMEGTDEAIRRGLSAAGPGAVVVKATRPTHDYRLDAPTIGAATLARCVEGGAAALALEAGRVVLLDREAIARLADQAGISVVGVGGDVEAR